MVTEAFPHSLFLRRRIGRRADAIVGPIIAQDADRLLGQDQISAVVAQENPIFPRSLQGGSGERTGEVPLTYCQVMAFTLPGSALSA